MIKVFVKPVLIACVLMLSGCMGKKVNYRPLLSEGEQVGSILIRNVTLFNGKDTVAIEAQDVFIKGGEIEWVGNTGTGAGFAAKLIDGTGKFLSPGFTDTHVHLMATGAVPWHGVAPDAKHNLEAFLACGITTVFDLGGVSSMLDKLEKKVADGKIPGPNILNTHSPITAPESHPIPTIKQLMKGPAGKMLANMIVTADEVADAKPIVADMKKKNVDYIKLICDQIPPGSPILKEEVMKAIIDESHSAGYKVFVHIGSPENAMAAVHSGADVIAHFPWRGALTAEQARQIAAAKVKMIFTLAGFDGVGHMCMGNFEASEVEKNHSHEEVYGPASGAEGKKILEQPVLGEFAKEVNANMEVWKSNVRLLNNAGVEFLVGTDSPIPGAYEGGSFHRELEVMNQMGIPNGTLMKSATSGPAGVIPGKNNWGTIEAGKKADLVLLDGNPLKDIRETRNINLVIKSGTVYTPLNNQ